MFGSSFSNNLNLNLELYYALDNKKTKAKAQKNIGGEKKADAKEKNKIIAEITKKKKRVEIEAAKEKKRVEPKTAKIKKRVKAEILVQKKLDNKAAKNIEIVLEKA